MRRAAHPSGCARCGSGAGCSAIKYQSLWWAGGGRRDLPLSSATRFLNHPGSNLEANCTLFQSTPVRFGVQSCNLSYLRNHRFASMSPPGWGCKSITQVVVFGRRRQAQAPEASPLDDLVAQVQPPSSCNFRKSQTRLKSRLIRCLCTEQFLICTTKIDKPIKASEASPLDDLVAQVPPRAKQPPLCRCRANLEHISQSRPDYGLGLSHVQCKRVENYPRCSLLVR